MMRHHRAVLVFLGSVFRSSSGSTLLWMIGALVVLGAVAAGVALMSPSASRGKLEQEAGMRAYYNANAGLQFLNSVSDSAENAQINFSKFTSQLGGTDVVTYTMPDNGTFSYQLGNLTTNGVNGTYQITNLIGTVQDANDKSAYSYVIYGRGKKSDLVNYTPRASENSHTPPSDIACIAQTLNFSGSKMTGNYIFQKYKFDGGVDIDGSLDYVGSSGCLNYTGGDLGLSDGTSHVCSNTCIILDNGHNVNGVVNAQTYVEVKNVTLTGDVHAGTYVKYSAGKTMVGDIYAVSDVTISNGTVKGNVYAGGNVTMTGGTVDGSIIASGDVTINLGTVKKNITSGGNVSAAEYNSHIDGDVQYYGAFKPQPAPWNFGGTATRIYTKPTAPSAPAGCISYTLPDYVEKEATVDDPKSPTTPYIIKGSTDINDKSWVFSSFNMKNSGTGPYLCLDLSVANSYINIFVNKDFNLNGYLYLKVTPDGECLEASTYSLSDLKKYAKRIYMEVGEDVNFSGNAQWWIGTIFAQGDIDEAYVKEVVGALYSHGTIDLGGGSTAYTVISDYVNQKW